MRATMRLFLEWRCCRLPAWKIFLVAMKTKRLSSRLTFIGLLVSLCFVHVTRAQNPAAPDAPKPKTAGQSSSQTISVQPQPQATTGRAISNPDGSVVTDNHYTNPFFKLAMDFPEGWVIFSNAQAKAIMEKNKSKIVEGHPDLAPLAKRPDLSAPLLAVAEPTPYKGGKTSRTFKLLASDVSGTRSQVTPVDYLNMMVGMAKEGKLPLEFMSKPEAVAVNGKTLGKAYAKMPWEGNDYYVAMYALQEKGYMLQFMFTSPDRDGLTDLEPWMKTLKFATENPNP